MEFNSGFKGLIESRRDFVDVVCIILQWTPPWRWPQQLAETSGRLRCL